MVCLKCFHQENITVAWEILDAGQDQCCDMSIEAPCEPSAMKLNMLDNAEMVKMARENKFTYFCRNDPIASCCCLEDKCNKDFIAFMNLWRRTAFAKANTTASECANTAIEVYINSTRSKEESTTHEPTAFPLNKGPYGEGTKSQDKNKKKKGRRIVTLIILISIVGLLVLLTILCIIICKRRSRRKRPVMAKKGSKTMFIGSKESLKKTMSKELTISTEGSSYLNPLGGGSKDRTNSKESEYVPSKETKKSKST